MSGPAVVLLSGGLDSTTVATKAVREGVELTALTFDYGQSHAREIAAARQIAEVLGIPHHVINVGFFRELAWYSALTRAQAFELPQGRSLAEMGTDIPITYVPLRNTFFLTLAAAFLESQALHRIEELRIPPEQLVPAIYIAANALDYSGYPDCRPEFFDTVRATLARGSKLGTAYGLAIRIEAPLLALSKADIVRLALEVQAPLEHTWSCYQGGAVPCEECDSCLLRAKGFEEAGVADPALMVGGARAQS